MVLSAPPEMVDLIGNLRTPHSHPVDKKTTKIDMDRGFAQTLGTIVGE